MEKEAASKWAASYSNQVKTIIIVKRTAINGYSPL
jgi:hypothetical protein